VPGSSILAGTPLLLGPASFIRTTVALRRRAGVTLATVFSGTAVAAGTPVVA
jgi:hypothetical protein